MKRWKSSLGKKYESPKIDLFLNEIEIVCRRYNLSISHEDGHGAFQIEEFNDHAMQWLKEAHDDRLDGDVS